MIDQLIFSQTFLQDQYEFYEHINLLMNDDDYREYHFSI